MSHAETDSNQANSPNRRWLHALVLLPIFFAGCGKGSTDANDQEPLEWIEVRIPAERVDAATTFAVELSKAANPMSDEEPEDMLKQVHLMTLFYFGQPVRGHLYILERSRHAPYEKVFVPHSPESTTE